MEHEPEPAPEPEPERHPDPSELMRRAKSSSDSDVRDSDDECSSPIITRAKSGMHEELKYWIDTGDYDINLQDATGMTALHYAAALGARKCLRLLVKSGKCNYLLKDNKGRYASELAFEWGRDYAVGVLLSKKQAKQAYEQGVPAWDKSG